ncbi:MAG TPA: hypothetical protein VJZ04_00855 [Lachnospiraceae bacterium]|nr:hypothetical protein [Lachnospiraceae bacterium]
MKKACLIITLILLFSNLSGEGSIGVSEESPQNSAEESTTFESILPQFPQCTSQFVHVKLQGSFVVKVRDVIPDYCLDEVTPQIAVVTCFQESPFLIYLGQEMASQLTVGESYVFEIEEMDVGVISKEVANTYPPGPSVSIPLYNLRIADIRIAEQDEGGLESINLRYVEID